MLIQITDPHIFCPLYLSFVRHQLVCNNAHKRGLSLAIGSYQTNVFSL